MDYPFVQNQKLEQQLTGEQQNVAEGKLKSDLPQRGVRGKQVANGGANAQQRANIALSQVRTDKLHNMRYHLRPPLVTVTLFTASG